MVSDFSDVELEGADEYGLRRRFGLVLVLMMNVL
jgi:hypothetical protein